MLLTIPLQLSGESVKTKMPRDA
uniref:Uncharacterized protein n=1 Tax=Arundo donax TaxID=35708 RepID=A0A0A9CIZ9_ARUDO